MAGIFISRGMTVAIPVGGLILGIGGKAPNSVTLHVRFDVCPTWIEIALKHLSTAIESRTLREVAWAGTEENAKSTSLEREFESSMQAIMAAAIALDAFYSILQTHVTLPPALIEKWRTGRTARYSQVTEVLRQAFRLKSKGTAALRTMLKDIYRFRDIAVHPSGKIEAPIYHPELDVGVEWRFAYFRATIAEQRVNAATWILWDLCHNGKPKDPKIVEYVGNLKQRLVELYPDGHPLAVATSSSPDAQNKDL
jgi:hypothetical protein